MRGVLVLPHRRTKTLTFQLIKRALHDLEARA